MIPLDLQSKIRDLTDVSHVILDKQVMSTNYYTLRGERLSFTRFVGSGVYLKETLYTDGTKEVTKIFISE